MFQNRFNQNINCIVDTNVVGVYIYNSSYLLIPPYKNTHTHTTHKYKEEFKKKRITRKCEREYHSLHCH